MLVRTKKGEFYVFSSPLPSYQPCVSACAVRGRPERTPAHGLHAAYGSFCACRDCAIFLRVPPGWTAASLVIVKQRERACISVLCVLAATANQLHQRYSGRSQAFADTASDRSALRLQGMALSSPRESGRSAMSGLFISSFRQDLTGCPRQRLLRGRLFVLTLRELGLSCVEPASALCPGGCGHCRLARAPPGRGGECDATRGAARRFRFR